MSIDPLTLAGLLGYEGEQATTYAAARLAQTEDREMRAFLRKIGAVSFVRRADGSLIAYDAIGRACEVQPPMPQYDRWHRNRSSKWKVREGGIPQEAERV